MRFKEGFSEARVPLFTMRIVLRPTEYAELTGRLASSSDPEELTGFFPAYRRAA
jgi:hypothetical protein